MKKLPAAVWFGYGMLIITEHDMMCNSTVIKFELQRLFAGGPAFFDKCFLPGPAERLLEIRFAGKMSDHII